MMTDQVLWTLDIFLLGIIILYRILVFLEDIWGLRKGEESL